MGAYIREHRWAILTLTSIFALIVLFTTVYGGPNMMGDTASYGLAIDVIEGGRPAPGYMPYRLLTTFGALEIVRFFGAIFGNMYLGWFFMNLILYVTSVYVLFALIRRITGSAPAACLGSLFLAGNYGYLLFGPTFLMDIGGWSFYIFTLYFIWRYTEEVRAATPRAYKYMLYAAACVGIGGLFKEYAFLGGAAIGAYLIIEAIRNKRVRPLGLLVTSGIISIIPVTILYTYIYHKFGYTYLDWFGMNAEHYVYGSRILEYIKSLGSLYTLLSVLVIAGVVVIIRQWRSISTETKIFLGATLVSCIPVFCWPAITQRILTITLPFSIIIASFFFKKYAERPLAMIGFATILVLYVLATFFMDSYLLNAVNLPF